MKNNFGKSRKTENPYLVFTDGFFEWRVLKKWQADDSKPFGRWFLATRSPHTFGSWELGDGYCADILRYGQLVYSDGTDGNAFGSIPE